MLIDTNRFGTIKDAGFSKVIAGEPVTPIKLKTTSISVHISSQLFKYLKSLLTNSILSSLKIF